jgi:hypothetical protein
MTKQIRVDLMLQYEFYKTELLEAGYALYKDEVD